MEAQINVSLSLKSILKEKNHKALELEEILKNHKALELEEILGIVLSRELKPGYALKLSWELVAPKLIVLC